MCMPNEHFTELLEFCYTVPFLTTEKGKCAYIKQTLIEKIYLRMTFTHNDKKKNPPMIIKNPLLYVVDLNSTVVLFFTFKQVGH